MNKPCELTAQEWEEVLELSAVQVSFGLEDEAEPAAWLRSYAYGVRFDYQNEGPGYVGPLYLLKSAGAPDTVPPMLVRTKEGLQALGGCLMHGPGVMRSPKPLCMPPICDGEALICYENGGCVCANPSCPNYMRYV